MREENAKAAGVSERTIARAKAVREKRPDLGGKHRPGPGGARCIAILVCHVKASMLPCAGLGRPWAPAAALRGVSVDCGRLR